MNPTLHEPSDPGQTPGTPPVGSVVPSLLYVCPYCGGATPDQPRCVVCRGFLDPLSRQASQNAMGAWFVRNEDSPYQAGGSYDTIVTLVKRGRVTLESVLRGPTTHQFWMPAKRVPGVSHLLGVCHSCGGATEPSDEQCQSCGVSFPVRADRQHLGLMPVRAVPRQELPIPEPAPSPDAVQGDAGSELLRRRLRISQKDVRNLWVWVAVLATSLGITLAALAAGFASGWLVIRSGGGGGVGRDKSSLSEPQPLAIPNAAASPTNFSNQPSSIPQANPPQPSPSEGEPAASGEDVASKTQTETERLVASDTEASLREAIGRLEALATRTSAEEQLLTRAKARLAQIQLRGVR
jgi:hypothetical protein